MKSKKLNKLARRGLTAALAGAMVLSMAAPAMAAVSPASGEVVTETTTGVKKNSINLYQADKTIDKKASGNNTAEYSANWNKTLATDGLELYYVDGAQSKISDNDIISFVGTEGTGKVSKYVVNISDNNLLTLSNAAQLGVDADRDKKVSSKTTTNPTDKDGADIRKNDSEVSASYTIKAEKLDDNPLVIALNAKTVSEANAEDQQSAYIKLDDNKPVEVTVTGFDASGNPVGSTSRIITIKNVREEAVIDVSSPDQRFEISNGTLNIDLDKFWKSNDDQTADESHVINVNVGDSTKSPVVPTDYEVKSDDSSIAEVIPDSDGNTLRLDETQKYFKLRGLKEGTTKITITRRAHGKYAAATKTINVKVEDTSIGLGVTYNHAKDGTEEAESDWNSWRMTNKKAIQTTDAYTGVYKDETGYRKDTENYFYGKTNTSTKSNAYERYDVLNNTIVTYTDSERRTNGDRNKGMFLDIVKNKDGKITSSLKNSKNVKITYDVPEQFKAFIACDNDGNVTVTADQFSFTDNHTYEDTYLRVIAKNTVTNRVEEIRIPIRVAKFAYTYVNVTNAEDYGQKTLKRNVTAGSQKLNPFIGERSGRVTGDSEYYKNNSLIPIIDTDSEGSEYYVVEDTSFQDMDYFYQMSTKDAKEWTIQLDTNDDSKFITFDSSNSRVASVDGNGKVTANKAGTAIITVTANTSSTSAGKTYEKDVKKILVNVTDKYKFSKITAPDAITVDATSNSVALGAKATLDDGTDISSNLIYGLYTKNGDGTYSAIDENKDGYADQADDHITVSNTGYVTYKKGTGTVYVGIAVKPNAKSLNTVTDNIKFVAVNYNRQIANEITLDKASAEMSVGNTAEVTAKTTTAGTFTVTSADPTVATAAVDNATGKITITGVKTGKTTVTVSSKPTDATYAEPKDVTIDVNVINNSLTVDPTSLTLAKAGDTATIKATTDAKTATEFTSENTAVATVDKTTGVVTAVAEGETNIVVTAGTTTVKVPVAVNGTKNVPTPVPKPTKVKKPTNFKAKNVKTRSIKVTAKKNGTITGFKVKYTPVGKPYDEKTVKGNKNLNTTIKGLKKGVTYKVKVQAYRRITKNGKKTTIFSNNTKVIKVTIKK